MNYKLLYMFMAILIILICTKFIEKYIDENSEERSSNKEKYTNMYLQSRTGISGVNNPFIFEKKHNYNHYIDKNKDYNFKVNENIIFYGKDEYARFKTDNSGNQYIIIKNTINNEILTLRENKNNSKEYDKFYASYINIGGDIIARLIRFKDNSYGIEVLYPTRKVIYRPPKTNVPTTQYFGSVGTIKPINDYNYSYSEQINMEPNLQNQIDDTTAEQEDKGNELKYDTIHEDNKDLYILKTQIVPPLCPICSTCPSCKKTQTEDTYKNTTSNQTSGTFQSDYNNIIKNQSQQTIKRETNKQDLCIKCPHCPECNITQVKQPKYIDFYKKDNISLENTVFPKFSDFDTANMTINKYLERNMYNNEFIPVPKLANFHNF